MTVSPLVVAFVLEEARLVADVVRRHAAAGREAQPTARFFDLPDGLGVRAVLDPERLVVYVRRPVARGGDANTDAVAGAFFRDGVFERQGSEVDRGWQTHRYVGRRPDAPGDAPCSTTSSP